MQEYGLNESKKIDKFNLLILLYEIFIILLSSYMTAQFLGQYFPKEQISFLGVSFYPFWENSLLVLACSKSCRWRRSN